MTLPRVALPSANVKPPSFFKRRFLNHVSLKRTNENEIAVVLAISLRFFIALFIDLFF